MVVWTFHAPGTFNTEMLARMRSMATKGPGYRRRSDGVRHGAGQEGRKWPLPQVGQVDEDMAWRRSLVIICDRNGIAEWIHTTAHRCKQVCEQK